MLFAATVIVCGALRPGYSHVTQFMSELGETGGSHSWLMNYGAFMPMGLLVVAFAVSLLWSFPRLTLCMLGAALVAIFGVGTFAAGVFSCDPGCPHRALSRAAAMHDYVSYAAFAAGISAPLVWGLHFRSVTPWRSLWVYSVVSSVGASVFFVVTAVSVESRAFTGIWQRLFLVILYLWCAVVGVRVFRHYRQ